MRPFCGFLLKQTNTQHGDIAVWRQLWMFRSIEGWPEIVAGWHGKWFANVSCTSIRMESNARLGLSRACVWLVAAVQNDICGVRTHALLEWRLKPTP